MPNSDAGKNQKIFLLLRASSLMGEPAVPQIVTVPDSSVTSVTSVSDEKHLMFINERLCLARAIRKQVMAELRSE